MQVIAAASPDSRAGRLAVVRSGAVAGALLACGLVIAWLIVSTPLIGSFIPQGRPSIVQVAAGITALTLAIVLPMGLVILGVARLARTVDAASMLRQDGLVSRFATSLGPDHLAVTDLVLPGGRLVNELVLGPFGVVVLGDVPPARASRHIGARWEIRGARGRWIPIEPPLDRASRDAERVRGWLTHDDRDFLVRVYAAVVTDDRRVERSATCAVVPPRELTAWLAGLPAQRGLTPERRERLAEHLRSAARRR